MYGSPDHRPTTIAEVTENTAKSITATDASKWKDGADIWKDSVARTRSKLRGKPVSMVWKFYYMATEKNAITKRARAKCKFCLFELDGRPERMLSHSENCKEILPHDRQQVYTMLVSKQKSTVEEQPSMQRKNDGVEIEHLYSST